jgi:GNAT superfamily N-acetyltransferase
MASINVPLSIANLLEAQVAEMVTIAFVKDRLPDGFEMLRHAADDEAYNMLGTLAREWASGENRFDGPGEALVAAYDGTRLVGMGAITHDPNIPTALRMRRFYVLRHYRRRGVGQAIAHTLLDRPESIGKPVTLNAPHAEAARFWEALGFVPDKRDGHTHVLVPAGKVEAD